jgi:ABC-type Na+ transport system ATPase subunit NatA
MLPFWGPNSDGKTTILKMIATLILPDKENVTVKSYSPDGLHCT